MIAQQLRYSPVNWLIVPWGFKGSTFNDCGLPKQQCCPDPQEQEEPTCAPLPVQEAINTYGWARWLPEVIVGIDDPDEDIAANYVRESAIEFCRDARILQREVVVPLQKGESIYPLFPYNGERIVGAISAQRSAGRQQCCFGCQPYNGAIEDVGFRLDPARNELHVEGRYKEGELLRVLVWATVTEDACAHDVFIYDAYRREIAQQARLRYATAVHFRDVDLMRSLLRTRDDWDQAILKAKLRAGSTNSSRYEKAGRLWQ